MLILGPERVLADRALQGALELMDEPGTEVVRVDATAYEPGSLTQHASPSLFGGRTVIVVRDLDEGPDGLLDETAALAADLPEEIALVAMHKGGPRGKRTLDALRQHDARVVDAPAIKSDRDKTTFAQHEFRSAGRRATPEAVRALVEAVGKDVAELAAACAQLVADTTGTIDEEVVARYHGGKIEATGFRVADAAIAGNAPEALRLARHAMAGGLDPVPIVAVLAQQLRQVARVATAGGGAGLAKRLGMAPWQIDRARTAARGWDGERLGRAIQAVAAADFEVKGGGRDPQYAVERAILVIAEQRRARS